MPMSTIIDKYMPLNDWNRIESLIGELRAIPGAMNCAVRRAVFENIKKAKLQIKFNDQYPESIFTDKNGSIPIVGTAETNNPENGGNNECEQSNNYLSIDYLPRVTQEDKKSVYGTYFEMAFHNFFITLHHIYSLIFGEDIMEVAKSEYSQTQTDSFQDDFANKYTVWNPLFTKLRRAKAEQKERFEELAIKHFPFLKALDALKGENRVSKVDALERFSVVVRELRNIYLHYCIIPSDKQKKEYSDNISFIFDLMDLLFTGAKREVKARFALSDDQMSCADKYETNSDRSLRDIHGKTVRIVPKKNFRYHLYKVGDDAKIITPFGLVFLASLFLEKKYAKILSDKAHVVRLNDKGVICEMISVYRIRLHINRLSISKSTDTLALDIINELQRCPKKVFELLPPVAQQRFRVKPESSHDPEALIVRHNDRFVHLLLKYIDDAKLFEHIRFQVSLGRYFFRFYDKICIDTSSEKRVRSICKDVHGFGRISEIEELRREKWKDILREYDEVHANTADEKPYITDHRANYLIGNNKVGIYLLKEGDEQCIMPELLPNGARNHAPTCWLSTYELPALAFLLHLYNADGARVEEIIEKQVAGYRRLFADVRDGSVAPVASVEELDELLKGYGDMQACNLPRKMLDYLLIKDVNAHDLFRKWAEAELQQMIEQTDRLSQRIDDDTKAAANVKQNKFGKKSFVAVKPGKIADFLAHDIMLFQPCTEDNSNKLTGLNFRILQSVMAVYNGDFDELSRVLRNAHIIGNATDEMCNPIVMAVCRKSMEFGNIVDFYKAYLRERRIYLERCLRHGDFESLGFLHASQIRWQERSKEYYRALAARYLVDEYGGTESAKAIELPRGLFEPYIRKELSEMNAMKSLACNSDYNVSYLIYGYFKRVMSDDAQPFYDEKKCYRLFNVLYRKSPHDSPVYRNTAEIRDMLMQNSPNSIRKDIESYLSNTIIADRAKEKERCTALLREMKKCETELKRYKIQDMLLFLIAKRILSDLPAAHDSAVQMQAISRIHLKDITDGNTLSEKISLSVKVVSKNGYIKKLTQHNLKLKNYSQFYAILSDRRLPSLLDLIRSNYINRNDIEAELDNYDKVHPEVMKAIIGFEKKHFDKHGFDDSGIVPDLSSILAETTMPADKQYEVRKIRNSFAHSHYPGYHVANAGITELPKKAETIFNTLKSSLSDEQK